MLLGGDETVVLLPDAVEAAAVVVDQAAVPVAPTTGVTTVQVLPGPVAHRQHPLLTGVVDVLVVKPVVVEPLVRSVAPEVREPRAASHVVSVVKSLTICRHRRCPRALHEAMGTK